MQLEPDNTSTKINTLINPLSENRQIGSLLILIFLVVFTVISFVLNILLDYSVYALILLILVWLIIPIIWYASIIINRTQLEYYTESIIDDFRNIHLQNSRST
ncbi:hypothetical protein D3C86_1720930 [compost metagenome]